MTALTVLFRDEHLIAVDKPSGLLVHRGWADDAVCALDLVREIAQQHVHPVHRLDRGTSGVLLFALDPITTAAVQRHFEQNLVQKRYLALVRGIPPQSGTIDHPVPKTEGGDRVDAVTDFRTLYSVERYSLVEAKPRTGRFHQIRRHLKHIGHPLIGDVNYGRGEHNRYFRQTFGLHRLALHAVGLALPHPHSGQSIQIRAEIPADLANPWQALGIPSTAWAD